jgi:cytidyltransferase-like protein
MEQSKRPWGEYKVIEKTKIIKVNPESSLSLQYHIYREEFWQILNGSCIVTIDGDDFKAKPGDTFNIRKKQLHRIVTESEGVELLEIATGIVDEDDIIRVEDIYGRESEAKQTVAVSGYFDPLHIGHIELFKLAKTIGDKLIVIVNNDYQAELKKGNPFMKQKERMAILENLEIIDTVVLSIDKDRTVCKTLELVRPDIFANGGDRQVGEIPETTICKNLGIKLVDGLGKKIQSSSWLTGLHNKDADSKDIKTT